MGKYAKFLLNLICKTCSQNQNIHEMPCWYIRSPPKKLNFEDYVIMSPITKHWKYELAEQISFLWTNELWQENEQNQNLRTGV